ncbi:MAG: hypothetical protein K0S61_3464 [Anaerocolumna sp.]|jgi:hypothetical protein|nr:hypothetical protein [Anaerocolumna sp.]
MRREDYDKISKWMYRNGRPLDMARWQYHFEGGSKENVLKSLCAYQNEDGGFGHALEADSWNEFSAPIQTWNAVEILREIDFTDRNHPMIQGILRFLKGAKDREFGMWLAEIPSNNDYPHAPWWNYDRDSIMEWGYNPTASLLGFILFFCDKKEIWYEEVYELSNRMIKEFLNKKEMDMHEISCFIQFLYYIEKGKIEFEDLDGFKAKLKELVNASINKNIKEWGVNYTCTPSRFIHHPASIFYTDNKELTDYECEFITNSRNEQGIWDFAWEWGKYPKEFAISQNWWKASIIIENLLFLRNFAAL